MLHNIIKSEIETTEWYEVEFLVDRNGGLGFPCDKDGNVSDLSEAAQRNYEDALAHPEKFPYCFNKVRKHTRSWKNPAHGTCDCGEEVYLVNQYMGACECDNCGRWYNMFGQQLKNPEYWLDEEY